MSNALLQPVVALVAWSLFMMCWMIATRFRAMKRRGILLKGVVGARGNALEGVVEDRVQWKAHNYAHLMEQPTIFYAVTLALAINGREGDLTVWLAWAYVALRILHSLVQATSNVVLIRLWLFLASSLALLGLTLHALVVVFEV